MTFAHPLVIDYGAGTKSLNFISNPVPYGSEYSVRETTQQFLARIRHLKEKPTQGGIIMDRHQFELTRTVFGTSGDPDIVQQAYLIFRMGSRDSVADAAKIGESVTKLLDLAAITDLGNWLS